ncbi:phage baseplate assembly protein V [Bacteroides heparinolyticus]|uniref:phage baseplate assembly protein V n=2 Tax=Prevotella heparinolytica TaxID=28113 RepID=UPI00359F1344
MGIFERKISVSIDGKRLFTFKSLDLYQRINDHHRFELVIDLEVGINRYTHNLNDRADWLGKPFSVHTGVRDETTFLGVITNVSLHRENSDLGSLIVTGYSYTYLLETHPGYYSWTDRSIGSMVQELTTKAGVRARVNPEYVKELKYECQYNESDFTFIRRLARQYGEWLYYDGIDLVFGKPKLSSPVKLEFGSDLTSLDIGVQALARSSRVFSYHSGMNQAMNKSTPDKPSGLDMLGYEAFESSMKMFPNASNRHALPRIHYMQELETYVKKMQEAETAESHYVMGTSENTDLTVGSVISLKSSFLEREGTFSSENLGEFLITEIRHTVSEASYYVNRFKAIPAVARTLPAPDVPLPLAEPQTATVVSNADPQKQGRVQVQMGWQKPAGQHTDWIRVMTPDGGSSDRVNTNRGFVFIPEVGDHVLVGFRYNDPNRPYVMGSLFNGVTGGGGGKDNKCKSLTTRSGISILFDDDGKSLHIRDASGNTVDLDGNGSIKINAPGNITLNAGGNMHLNVGNDLRVNVGNSQTTVIGNTLMETVMQKMFVNTPFMQQLVSGFFHTQAGKALINSRQELKIEAPETSVVGEQKLFMHSSEKAVVNSQGTMEVRGEQGTSEYNQALPYQKTVEEKAKHCVVYFKRKNGYKGEYGFDWFRMGENAAMGDSRFSETIGHHYETDRAGKKITCRDGNKAYRYPFEVLSTSVNRKKNSFEQFIIGFKRAKARIGVTATESFTYFVPRMTMMPGTTAEIIAEVELEGEKTKPKEIKLKLDKEDGLKLSQTTLPVKAGKVKITITCTSELKEKRTLTVLTDDGDTAGKLFILPNSKQHQRNIKVVFVKVKTILDRVQGEKTGKISQADKDLFINVLHQALINVDGGIKEAEINCTERTFKVKFCTEKRTIVNNILQKKTVIKDDNITASAMRTNMLNVLKAKYDKQFDGYYTVFFFGDKSERTNGYAYPNSTYGVFFDGHKPSTVPHELLHALGLEHSFDAAGGAYGYQYHTTDNIMDYSHHQPNPIERVSLFYWQWKKINKNIGKNETSYFNINSGTMQFLQQRTKEQGDYDNENNGED